MSSQGFSIPNKRLLSEGFDSFLEDAQENYQFQSVLVLIAHSCHFVYRWTKELVNFKCTVHSVNMDWIFTFLFSQSDFAVWMCSQTDISQNFYND